MKTTLICAAIGACAACGTPEPTSSTVKLPIQQKIHPNLQPFVEEFLADCETRRSDCVERLSLIESMDVVDIPDLNTKDDEIIVGLCYDRFYTKKIEVNKLIMNKPYIYTRLLMYHELGHCAYGLDHEDDPHAIMAPSMPEMWVIAQNWPEMVMDLFGTIQQKHGD